MKIAKLMAVAALLAAAPGAAAAAEMETAIFAGGCFWCMEEAYEEVPGVSAVVSGYAGGEVENPTYKQVSSGSTGHYEVVEVEYDPGQVTYEELVEVFWRNVDPFDDRGQFCDKGSQYLSAIFVKDDEERKLAEATKEEVAARFSMPVSTEILAESVFYPAEDYHQDFYKTNSARYKFYKFGCGRVQRLEEIWGKPAT
ncbi:MAG TPA: peptide-methionine (S)-S-oxide reductase MsrA [Propylenella sp.]